MAYAICTHKQIDFKSFYSAELLDVAAYFHIQ